MQKSIRPYIPYSGGKQRISERIVGIIKKQCPTATTAIDIFGGGASMSFEFLKQGYQKVVYNEKNTGYYTLLLFLKKRREYCIKNNLPLVLPDYFYDFVSKEKYGNIKTTPDELWSEDELAYKYFVLACYTFNNLQKKQGVSARAGYLYGESKITPNYYVHQALIHKDKTALRTIKEYFGALGNLANLLDCCLQDNLQKAIYDFNIYISILTFLHDNLTAHPNVSPIIMRLNEEYEKDKNYFEKHTQRNLCRLFLMYGMKYNGHRLSCGEFLSNGAWSCNQLERLQHIQAVLQLPLEKLELYNLDYVAVPFDKYENFIVYADPPYFNTLGYHDEIFDFSRFSGWCFNFSHPLFVSEITNPNPGRLVSIWHHKIKDNVSALKLRKEQLFFNNVQK